MTRLLTVALLLIASSVSAQDKKISALPSASPLQATDMLPIARAGDNFRLAGSDFLTPAGGTLTGPLLFPDGTSSAPSGAFASSPTTGFYLGKTGTDLDVSDLYGNTFDGNGFAFKVPTCDWVELGCASMTISGAVDFNSATGYEITRGIDQVFNVSGTQTATNISYLYANDIYVSSTADKGPSGGGVIAGYNVDFRQPSGSISSYYGLNSQARVSGGAILVAPSYLYLSAPAGTYNYLYGNYNYLDMGDNTEVNFRATVSYIAGPATSTAGTDSSKIFKIYSDGYGRSQIDQPRDTDYALELTNGKGLLVTGKTDQLQLAKAAGGARPTCDAAARGSIWYEPGGAGVLDTLEICRKDAANNYAWVSLF